MLTALSVAAVVCIASSNGGTTSQDLKTGYLVGATPSKQQLAILVGALTSALVIGGTMLALNAAGTHYTNKGSAERAISIVPADAPQQNGSASPHEGRRQRIPRRPRPQETCPADEAKNRRRASRAAIWSMTKATRSTAPTCRSSGKCREMDNGQKPRRKRSRPRSRSCSHSIIEGILGGKLEWGAGHHRRADRPGAGTGGRVGVAVRGRHVSAARARRRRSSSAACLRWVADRAARRIGLRGRDGDQSRRAALQRLHRRRHAVRPGHRVLRVPAGRCSTRRSISAGTSGDDRRTRRRRRRSSP